MMPIMFSLVTRLMLGSTFLSMLDVMYFGIIILNAWPAILSNSGSPCTGLSYSCNTKQICIQIEDKGDGLTLF